MADQMDPLELAKRAVGIHEKIAADLPQGGVLRCSTCRREAPIRDGDVARYLARGWPKCHGTMEWVTAPASER